MKRRGISVFMLLAMLLCCLGVRTEQANAGGSGIQKKLNKIKEIYPSGSYFTVASSTAGCTSSNHDVINGVWCQGCYLPSIPARGGLPSGASVGYGADTCCGFASYVFYCVFGHNHVTNTTVKYGSPVLGDLVFTGSHWFIYLSEDSTNYYVYDANGYNGSKNKVVYNNYYPKNAVSSLTVYHANNYDDINGTVPVNWASVSAGEYYFYNAATGKQLDVQSGEDYNGCNVAVYVPNTSDAQRWVISGNSNGYKIKPKCTASRVLNCYGTSVNSGNNVNLWDSVDDNTQRWVFEKVSNGYIIHSAGNTSCVLDVDENGNVCVCTYAGRASQVWTLKKTAVPATPTPTAKPATPTPTAKPATPTPTAKPATPTPTAKPASPTPTIIPATPTLTQMPPTDYQQPTEPIQEGVTETVTPIPEPTQEFTITEAPTPDPTDIVDSGADQTPTLEPTNEVELVPTDAAKEQEGITPTSVPEKSISEESPDKSDKQKGISWEQILIYVLIAIVAVLGTLLVVSKLNKKK